MTDQFTTTDNGKQQIFTVSELNAAGKKLLESSFSSVWIEGEISNLVKPTSGHWYFTLKDETSWSFEVGLKQGFQIKDWKAFVDVSFFWQEYKNFIEYSLKEYLILGIFYGLMLLRF